MYQLDGSLQSTIYERCDDEIRFRVACESYWGQKEYKECVSIRQSWKYDKIRNDWRQKERSDRQHLEQKQKCKFQ